MRRADMLQIVFVEIAIQRDAGSPQGLVVLRARQRREAEELQDVEGQLLLDDRDVAPDRLGRVAGKSKDITGEREDAVRLPGKQHLAIFGDLVLPLLGGGQIVRIDVLEPDEDAGHSRTFGLFDEIRDLVAKGVDLDHQREGNAIPFSQLDQTIEDRLPVLVAREVIVGDEEPINALGPVETYQPFDVVRAAIARFAALDIDDRAERALVRAAAAGIEARIVADRPHHVGPWQERRRRAVYSREIVQEIVDRRQPARGCISQYGVQAALLRLAGEDGNPHVPAGVEADRMTVEHR